jgi:hypothetical protein
MNGGSANRRGDNAAAMPTGGMIGGGAGTYEGSDIATGSQTPEGVTTPTPDVFDAGTGGTENGGGGSDNGNAGS